MRFIKYPGRCGHEFGQRTLKVFDGRLLWVGRGLIVVGQVVLRHFGTIPLFSSETGQLLLQLHDPPLQFDTVGAE